MEDRDVRQQSLRFSAILLTSSLKFNGYLNIVCRFQYHTIISATLNMFDHKKQKFLQPDLTLFSMIYSLTHLGHVLCYLLGKHIHYSHIQRY